MKKIYWYMLCLFAIVIIPLKMMTASAAEVTEVRWVTRNDAPISYVRIVLDLTEKVDANAIITRDGLATKLVLKDTKMKEAPKRMRLDRNIVKSAMFTADKGDLNITLQTPVAIEPSDIKVFQLNKDDKIKKPVRLVIDVSQKNVKPRDHYFGMEKNEVDSKHLDKKKIKYKPRGKVDIKKLIKDKLSKDKKKKKVELDGEEVIYLSDFRTDGGLKGKIITIDPGHGGTDVGALGTEGRYEKDFTLLIGKALEKRLKKAGAIVLMTRDDDYDVYGPRSTARQELQARSDVANDQEADVLISLHINAFTNPEVGGISSYYFPKTVYDKKLAAKIGKNIVKVPGFGGDRGVNEAGFYVLKHTTMPAVLLELGFITNPKEEKLLLKEKVQKAFAEKIYEGLVEYFDGGSKDEKK